MIKDVQSYDRVALEVNAPVYAYYAEKILEKTGIYKGVCLDVGCGGGYLGLALAAMTELEFLFLDQSVEMLGCARNNIDRFVLEHRARTVHAPVQNIPLADNSVDLIISRGSVPFWDELPAAFSELYRILKSGGRVYVGGGMGPPELKAQLQEMARKLDPTRKYGHPAIPRRDSGVYEGALAAAGIKAFSVNRGDDGTWIEFGKE